MAEAGEPIIDTSVPHEARMYDYWLGGKDNYAPDRELGDLIRAQVPTISTMAHANRAVLRRMVRHLVTEAGVTQFLDIGTGIPTAPNVHQVVQEVRPDARVLYVDKDPLVLAHARALMVGTPEGRTAFTLADFREPESILDSAELRSTLDLDRPVALLLVAILMYFDPENGEDPYAVVARLLDGLPSGSFLAVTHPTADFDPAAARGVQEVARKSGMTILPRSEADVARFFTGLEMVEPGLVPVPAWRPDEPVDDPRSVYYYAGLGRKP
ncbi:MAG: SAM-dependent methyltransferase [Pseudonocardia sp.]|nr:SAM-dependent methyltransferase [Pseudonocardia sp.]